MMKKFTAKINDTQTKREIYLVLDNLRSAHNVGALFRTADACGVKKIFLCGITPTPSDEKQGNRRVKKAAVGADKFVVWEKIASAEKAIQKLRKNISGVQVLALEQAPESLTYTNPKIRYKSQVALIVGNEIKGVGERALKNSDYIIEIPMFGKKNSLNVASATAIVLYRIKLN